MLACLDTGNDNSPVCLRADHPFPPRPLPPDDAQGMYFEVKIFATETQTGPDSNNLNSRSPTVTIGLCGQFSDQSVAHVGWNTWTVGYHGDNGGIYDQNPRKTHHTGRTFGLDDTVGCGVDYDAGEYFFTLGGQVIGMSSPEIFFRFTDCIHERSSP
jgi:Ran-binding protein 9/10